MKVFNKLLYGSVILQYLCLVAVTFNIICSGLYVGWPTPSLPQILSKNSTIPTTDDEGSWIATMLLIGAVCGSLMAAVILDRLGRKLTILLTSIPFFLSWILTAFANTATLLMVARFIAGISEGLIFCSVPVYLAEIAEPKIRGFIGSSITVANLFGMLLVNIIGSYLNIKTTALICSTVPVLLLVTFIWMPESPYYLIMKGNFDQARHSLTFFRKQDEVEGELKKLTIAVKEQNRNTGRYLDLFTVKSNRKAVYIMMGIRFGQQFSGSVAIMLYAQIIFEGIGDDIMSPITASTVYLGVQLLISIICTINTEGYSDKFGNPVVYLLEDSNHLIQGQFYAGQFQTTKFIWILASVLCLLGKNNRQHRWTETTTSQGSLGEDYGKNGGSRPIAVGSTICRLVSKLCCKEAAEVFILSFKPKQLGFLVKGGTEAAVHRTYTNDDKLWSESALPSSQLGTLLDKNSPTVAISSRLDNNICKPYTCACEKVVDTSGVHGLSCNKSAERDSMHPALNGIMKRLLLFTTILKPTGLMQDDGKRANGMTTISWKNGRALVWDDIYVNALAT
ncbi:hypothetical protein ILUMI_18240 [Ignelater luminosus]|uniref:Major facilitator superfamily (MFS) profile domain-containing protein n=1 Tax=Ignelater luminosus TaxID=2038154 RepID=A0A8K0CID5_IGNLU|nr:hypothetical protein ILUMI_18240 [Ignelater luminosus]